MRMLFVFKSYEWLGIEYLSAGLKKAGHKTDLAFERGLRGTLYFSDFIKKEDHSHILEKISEFKPDMILFSSTTNLFLWVREVASVIKKNFKLPILVGGIHPTIQPETVISDRNIDMICVGEGEEAIVELANKIDNCKDYHHTENIWFKVKDNIIKNKVRPLVANLDDLPFPDKDMFYKYGCFTNRAYIMTSRGCPYKCPYCYNHQLQRLYKGTGCNYVRKRSVDSVIDELESYKKKYRINSVHFYDDTFNLYKDWTLEFSAKYEARIGLPFYCGLKADLVTDEVVEALRKAHCVCVGMAIESGNDYIRNTLLRRGMSDSQIFDAAKIIKANNIKLVTFNMFCFPSETPEQMLDTVHMNLKIKPDGLFTFTFYPFPGTQLMQTCIEQNYIDTEAYDKIMEGRESYTSKSLLKHTHKEFAYGLKIILPLLNKLPQLARDYFLKKWIFKSHPDLLLSVIKIISIPFYNPWEARARILEQASMLKTYYLGMIMKWFSKE